MRVLVVGTLEEEIRAVRTRVQEQGNIVVGSTTWEQAVAAFDAAQPDSVVLASDPGSPLAIGVVWMLRARNPFLAISPPGISAPSPSVRLEPQPH